MTFMTVFLFLIPLFLQVSCLVYIREHLGCWRDGGTRAIAGGVRFETYNDPIYYCQKYAAEREWPVFAVQNGNQCFTAADAGETYDKYGESTRCYANGRGGVWAQNVYRISCTADFCLQEKYTLLAANKRAAAIETQLGEEKDKLLALETELVATNNRAASFETQLNEEKAKRVALETELVAANNRAAGFETQLNEENARRVSLEAELVAADNKAEKTDFCLEEKYTLLAELVALETKLKAEKNMLEEADKKVEVLKAEIKEVKDKLVAADKRAAGFETELNEEKAKLVALETELKAEKDMLEEADKKVEVLKAEIKEEKDKSLER